MPGISGILGERTVLASLEPVDELPAGEAPRTLVLINGRRRHQSSLINIFGSRGRGNTGTDLNAIPLASIERIEILRDGASAQYGSDAIAGVVNVVLKSNINKLTGSIGTGVHEASYRTDRDYDGEEFLMNGNYGFELGENGFMNLSFDYLRKGKTNRPADPNVYSIYRRQFGDASLNNFGTIFNSRFAISKNTIFYVWRSESQIFRCLCLDQRG